MNRTLVAVIVGLFAIAASVYALSANGRAQTLPAGSVNSIQAPAQIKAGDAFEVTVALTDAPDGTIVDLMLQGTFGPRLFRSASTGGSATFAIPSDASRESGVATLVATLNRSSAQAKVTISPGAPVEPLLPLIGARSIVADGKSWAMVVVVPSDALGNPVADGTTVNLRANHPDGSTQDRELSVQHLTAWTRVTSGLVAGKTTVAVSSGAAHGPEGSIVEVAGWPAAFSVSAFPSPIPADGRAVTTLKTSYMVDGNGNVITDGTLVTFIVKDETGGDRRIPAIVVGGVAQAALVAPDRATTFDVWATVYSVESAHAQVTFSEGPAIGNVAVSARVDTANGVVAVDSGPWIGSLGQFAPDGSTVTFTVVRPDGMTSVIDATVSAGHAAMSLRLVDYPPGRYFVTAALGSASGSTAFDAPAVGVSTPVATP